MYLSLIVTFLLLLVLVIFGIQNSMPSEVKFDCMEISFISYGLDFLFIGCGCSYCSYFNLAQAGE